MSQKVTFRISAAAAPYVGEDKPLQARLKAAAGQVALPPSDLVSLVYYLCHDPDPEVRRTAVATLRGLDVSFLAQLLSNSELHPRILDALVQLHFKNAELAPLFAAHPMLSEKAARFLAQQGVAVPPRQGGGSAAATGGAGAASQAGAAAAPAAETSPEAAAGPSAQPAAEAASAGEKPADENGAVDESAEEYQSKYQMAQTMGVAEKIKMALTGDKEWRSILIKDYNKLVSGAAIKNPRMTEAEVLAVLKSSVQNEEVMRVICANKEWVKNYQIRKALVENHKTPLPSALRYVATLSEKDLSLLAKSKNVNTAISTQARRILMTKKEGR